MKNRTNRIGYQTERDAVFSLNCEDLFSESDLSKSDCKLIKKEVDNILHKRKKSSCLIDIVAIVNQHKISVRKGEFPNSKVYSIAFFEPYARKSKGIIHVNEDFKIPESEADYQFRCSRYVTACMFGYYVLYWKKKHVFKLDRALEKEGKYIERIRYFARCLTMPEGMLLPALDFSKQLFKDEEGRIKSLAHAFSVPCSVVKRRFGETNIPLDS